MKRRLIVCLLPLFWALTAMAQLPETMLLSLEGAKQYAVEHNRTVQNAGLSVKQAEAARWQTIASMLPQVSGSLDYANMCGYEVKLAGMP
ncbi:MAG: hypothetical protein UHZ06_03295, partial [Paludibacteraceae bacterium]|nr:hypothetical protein [Paludibacteraceae bacterium]